MVRVGFIVEGDSEKIFIESEAFQQWAQAHNIEICERVINAGGGGNLLPQNIGPMMQLIQTYMPDHIVILTDLEDADSVDTVKKRINTIDESLIFVAVKALEAWFLADGEAMSDWLKVDFYEPNPEETAAMPYEHIKQVAENLDRRGPGNKKAFAKKMTKHHTFQVSRAAAHPACPSAKTFHDGLIRLGQTV